MALASSWAMGPPVWSLNFTPRYWGGLWLAVSMAPPAASRWRTAKERRGVGTGPLRRTALSPIPERWPARARAKASARKRVSYPTTTRPPPLPIRWRP